MKKIFFLIVFVFIFQFCLAAGRASGKYYYIILKYNSQSGEVSLTADPVFGDLPRVTESNFTDDTGKGSQFYARVAKADGNFKLFPNGTKKFYLGHWEMWRFWDGIGKDGNPIGGSEELSEGNVQVSIPYFPDGTAINIYDAKTDQLKLSLDVSKFSGTREFRNFSPDQSQPTESNNNLWTILAIVAGILFLGGGVVYFFLKKIFFKKTS